MMTRGAEALADSARRAHLDAMSGRFGELAAPLLELEATTHPVARAWALALRAELWLAEPRYGLRPSPELLADFVDGPVLARHGALAALASGARSAAITFDGPALGRLGALSMDLARGLDDEIALGAELVLAWAELSRGDAPSALERATELGRRAVKLGLAALVVDGQAARAFAASALGEHAQALELARRASLMARTEGIPQPEFLAHLVLARARRHAGQPHLALRILESLAPVLPAPWMGWHAWESVFATGRILNSPRDPGLPVAAGVARAMLDAATRADRSGFESAAAELETAIAPFAPMHAEALELCAAIAPEREPPSAELAAWRSGQTLLTPAALHGLRARAVEGDETAAAYVWLVPGHDGVRLLHWGLPLVERPGLERVRQSQRAQGRVETLLSILALAGAAGIDEARCFHEAYGFPMVPEIHRGVFDVLVHRARTSLGESARIDRDEGRLVLVSTHELLIPDPRVSQRTTDRVLRLLAERGTASAKDAAVALGISLRSAQAALSELAGGGACEARKDGRNVAYVVEDTVFSEPSRRLLASDLSGLTRLG